MKNVLYICAAVSMAIGVLLSMLNPANAVIIMFTYAFPAALCIALAFLLKKIDVLTEKLSEIEKSLTI